MTDKKGKKHSSQLYAADEKKEDEMIEILNSSYDGDDESNSDMSDSGSNSSYTEVGRQTGALNNSKDFVRKGVQGMDSSNLFGDLSTKKFPFDKIPVVVINKVKENDHGFIAQSRYSLIKSKSANKESGTTWLMPTNEQHGDVSQFVKKLTAYECSVCVRLFRTQYLAKLHVLSVHLRHSNEFGTSDPCHKDSAKLQNNSSLQEDVFLENNDSRNSLRRPAVESVHNEHKRPCNEQYSTTLPANKPKQTLLRESQNLQQNGGVDLATVLDVMNSNPMNVSMKNTLKSTMHGRDRGLLLHQDPSTLVNNLLGASRSGLHRIAQNAKRSGTQALDSTDRIKRHLLEDDPQSLVRYLLADPEHSSSRKHTKDSLMSASVTTINTEYQLHPVPETARCVERSSESFNHLEKCTNEADTNTSKSFYEGNATTAKLWCPPLEPTATHKGKVPAEVLSTVDPSDTASADDLPDVSHSVVQHLLTENNCKINTVAHADTVPLSDDAFSSGSPSNTLAQRYVVMNTSKEDFKLSQQNGGDESKTSGVHPEPGGSNGTVRSMDQTVDTSCLQNEELESNKAMLCIQEEGKSHNTSFTCAENTKNNSFTNPLLQTERDLSHKTTDLPDRNTSNGTFVPVKHTTDATSLLMLNNRKSNVTSVLMQDEFTLSTASALMPDTHTSSGMSVLNSNKQTSNATSVIKPYEKTAHASSALMPGNTSNATCVLVSDEPTSDEEPALVSHTHTFDTTSILLPFPVESTSQEKLNTNFMILSNNGTDVSKDSTYMIFEEQEKSETIGLDFNKEINEERRKELKSCNDSVKMYDWSTDSASDEQVEVCTNSRSSMNDKANKNAVNEDSASDQEVVEVCRDSRTSTYDKTNENSVHEASASDQEVEVCTNIKTSLNDQTNTHGVHGTSAFGQDVKMDSGTGRNDKTNKDGVHEASALDQNVKVYRDLRTGVNEETNENFVHEASAFYQEDEVYTRSESSLNGKTNNNGVYETVPISKDFNKDVMSNDIGKSHSSSVSAEGHTIEQSPILRMLLGTSHANSTSLSYENVKSSIYRDSLTSKKTSEFHGNGKKHMKDVCANKKKDSVERCKTALPLSLFMDVYSSDDSAEYSRKPEPIDGNSMSVNKNKSIPVDTLSSLNTIETKVTEDLSIVRVQALNTDLSTMRVPMSVNSCTMRSLEVADDNSTQEITGQYISRMPEVTVDPYTTRDPTITLLATPSAPEVTAELYSLQNREASVVPRFGTSHLSSETEQSDVHRLQMNEARTVTNISSVQECRIHAVHTQEGIGYLEDISCRTEDNNFAVTEGDKSNQIRGNVSVQNHKNTTVFDALHMRVDDDHPLTNSAYSQRDENHSSTASTCVQGDNGHKLMKTASVPRDENHQLKDSACLIGDEDHVPAYSAPVPGEKNHPTTESACVQAHEDSLVRDSARVQEIMGHPTGNESLQGDKDYTHLGSACGQTLENPGSPNTCPAHDTQSQQTFEAFCNDILQRINTGSSENQMNKVESCGNISDKRISVASTDSNNKTLTKTKQTNNVDSCLRCTICGFCALNPRHLKQHAFTHVGRHILQCEKCREVFKQEHELKHHDCVLLWPPPTYEDCTCASCNVTFKSFERFFKHFVFKHLASTCQICFEEFKNKNSLLNHMKLKHKKPKPKIKHQYPCEVCGTKFVHSAALKTHQKVHVQQALGTQNSDFHEVEHGSSACTLCSYKSQSTQNVLKHAFRHSGRKPFHCEKCGEQFLLNGYLKNHTCHDTGGGLNIRVEFRCSKCSIAFDNRHEYLDHFKATHFKRCNYQCSLCLKSFKDLRTLRQHEKAHSALFKCDKCDKIFASMQYLRKHKAVHSDRTAQCHICSKLFYGESDVISHIHKAHSEESFPCSQCPKTFQSRAYLLRHVRKRHKDSDISPVLCSQCPKICKSAEALKAHAVSHQTERSHACSQCDKKFKTRSAVREHKKCHSGFRPYECDECGDRFIFKHHLKAHMLKHSGERPFKCQVCGKGFGRKQILETHMHSHTGVREFHCENCNKDFFRKTDLNKHMRLAHANSND